MGVVPSSPPPDAGWWLNVVDHLEAIIVGISTAVVTAGVGLWRAAIWTERMKTEIRRNREASEARHEVSETASFQRHQEILQKLEDMKASNALRYEATQRELDQVTQSTRALSSRIDTVFARGG